MDEHEPWYLEENPSEQYERLLAPSKFLAWAAELVDLSELGSGGKILDVACGTGPSRGSFRQLLEPPSGSLTWISMWVDWPLRQTSHGRRVAILNG